MHTYIHTSIHTYIHIYIRKWSHKYQANLPAKERNCGFPKDGSADFVDFGNNNELKKLFNKLSDNNSLMSLYICL